MGILARGFARYPVAAWLLAGLMAISLVSGATGCSSKSSEEARKELEELKKKKKPKDPFDRLQVVTEPSEKVFIAPKPPKEDELGALASDKPEAEAEQDTEFALRRYMKPGHWTGVLITTTANNFDFSGELTSEPRDSSQQILDWTNSAFHLSTARPAALAKGQRKTLESIFFAPPREATTTDEGRRTTLIFNQLRDRRSGTVELPQGDIIQHLPSYQYYMYVLAKNSARYRYFKVLDSVCPPLAMPTVIADDQHYYRVLAPQPEAPLALPTQPLAWTSIAYVVWDDVLPNVMTPNQQQAMIDWLHWGGNLIVSGPRTLDTMRGTFLEPYLPAGNKESVQLDLAALAPLNEYWTIADRDGVRKPLEPAKAWQGIKLEKHPEAVYLNGAGELAAERRVGRGRIVVTAFRLSEQELLDWPSFDGFVNGCLLRRAPRDFASANQFVFAPREMENVGSRFDPAMVTSLRYFSRDTVGVADAMDAFTRRSASVADPATAALAGVNEAGQPYTEWYETDQLDRAKCAPGVAAWNDTSTVSTAARDSLREAAGISVPNRRFVLWMVGLYLLIVVPVNWLVFRLAGRVEWAWLAVPVLAIGWGIVVVWLAQLDIGFARAETEVAVLETQGGFERAHLTRYMALYSSLSTTYNVHFDDPSALAQPFALDRAVLAGQSREMVTLRSMSDQQLDGFTVSSNSTGMVHSEQMVSLNGTLDWQHPPEGTPHVENNSRLKLSGVAVLRRTAQLSSPEHPGPGPIRDEIAWVGELPPGTKAELTFTDRETSRGEIFRQREAAAVTRRRRPDGTLSLRRLVNLASEFGQMNVGDVRLVGWFDGRMPGAHADPLAAQSRGATLVVAHLKYGDFPATRDKNMRPFTPPEQP